jgi:hypothetical protein
VRLDDGAIGIAISMSKREACRSSTFNDELPSVHCAVVCRAQDDEPIRIVVPAFGSRRDVMNVEENAVTATRNCASAAVSPHDMAADCGRNLLARAGVALREGGTSIQVAVCGGSIAHVGITRG